MSTQGLPPVAPDVTADIIEALTPRLRKRLDAAIAKLAACPIARDGDTVRITVGEDAELTLSIPTGSVTRVEDLRCSCLLAPACVHRAAAAASAPVADGAPEPAPDTSNAPDTPDTSTETPDPGTTAGQAGATEPTAAERAAADALWTAGAAIVDAGVDTAGAVLQAGLLRAAHTARLAGLHRASAAAVAVATGLRAARSGDPAYRLAELVAALRELLDVAHALRTSTGESAQVLDGLRGTSRRAYAPAGSLRLYGLFTEPVLTARGFAGAVTTTVDPTGTLRTIGDVAPGGADRAVGAATRAIRVGDTSIDPAALTRAGLVVSGATASAGGRLGAGQGVRAARASGAAWTEEPLRALWDVPPATQVDRVVGHRDLPTDDRPAGVDLLFLDVTVLGPTPGARDRVRAVCAGLDVHLLVAHADPAFAYRDNLRLLATCPGLRLRLIGRLEPGADRAIRVLAVGIPPGEGPTLRLAEDRLGRVDLGLDRLHRADLPDAAAIPVATVAAEELPAGPLYLMHRHVERAISGGRPVLALAGSTAADTARLRRVGLATGAGLVERLTHVAAGRERDVFGRLRAGDNDLLSAAWLAAAVYAQTVEGALTRAVWSAE
ncbi:SWIM zinc finger family protein [Embleya scabrispora]|uniref:SWIM zinc finger family protein n=1 Tax=Embleya scabrispora TaxID=159449 RepID=UPI00037231B2|nr:SWIM zinc finger family protein [Embleya scabrispora]MYS84450.1 hypothetical protein [Streptomyces sp. SID5474]